MRPRWWKCVRWSRILRRAAARPAPAHRRRRCGHWRAEAAAELKENGVEIAEYDDVLGFLAAETEPQTVLADPASVNYAVYETLSNNAALTVKDEADPLLPMKA